MAEVDEKTYYNALAARHGELVQKAIAKAEVTICGLGGLGSNIAIALARCGIGGLHLIDFDCVDLQNCNRQQYGIEQIGQPKTESLVQVIRFFNPYVSIRTSRVRLTEDNLGRYLEGAEFICEAFDDAVQKAMLTNYVLEHCRDAYLVGASGMAGYGKNNEIRTRKVLKHFYLCGDEKNGLETGQVLMAPRVMLCAAHQANQILELIITKKKTKE